MMNEAGTRSHASALRQANRSVFLMAFPVAVKDELDMVPYPTTVGTSFLGKSPAKEDATVVARMRAAGALLVGKANMHEIGINVTGLNPRHVQRATHKTQVISRADSSSGSATAIAAGLVLCPRRRDGGGSIRHPCFVCGVFGLKPILDESAIPRRRAFGLSIAMSDHWLATATDTALGLTL